MSKQTYRHINVCIVYLLQYLYLLIWKAAFDIQVFIETSFFYFGHNTYFVF